MKDRTSNIQHRTSNVELKRPTTRVYDLEERLLNYAAEIIRVVEQLPRTRSGNHVAGQMLRSGTSPLPNHGEAQGAESPADFVHKLRVSLKEFRETYRWLLLIQRVPLIRDPASIQPLIVETDELIRVFVASIETSTRKSNLGRT